MMGIALGSSISSGILIRGFANYSAIPNNGGGIMYLSTTAGDVSSSRPSGSTQYVRILGYGVANDIMYFNPDNTWVELA
jgi:hypothetical protein